MRASSWASTTTRRARSVNRSNMPIAPLRGWWGTRQHKTGDARSGATSVTGSNWSPSLRVPGPDRAPSAHSERAGSHRRLRTVLMRGLERLAHVGRDPAAVGHLVAVGPGPVADLAGTGAHLGTSL